MKNKLSLGLILVVTLFVSLLTLVLIRTFIPVVILPKFDVCSIALVSLIALVINYYLNKDKYSFIAILFAFVAFGVLPFAAGFVTVVDALLLAVKGGIIELTSTLYQNKFDLSIYYRTLATAYYRISY